MAEGEGEGSRQPGGSPSVPFSPGSAGPRGASRLRALAEETAADLDVERVGVWLFEEGRGALRRVHLHDREAGTHGSGGLLTAGRFPAYFRALREEGELAVERAAEDPRTRELAAPYARPLGIASWLDVPLPGEGELPAGFLRLEQVGRARSWRPSDRERARKAAEAASRALGASPGPEAERPPGGGELSLPPAALDDHPAGLAVLALDGTVQRCNAAFAELLGYGGDPGELRGVDLVERHFEPGGTWQELASRLGRGERVTGHELRVRTSGEPSERWLLLAVTAVRLAGEEDPGALVAAQDITDRWEREERLRRQAHRDPLTGLANRRLLRATAERTLALAERHGRTAGLLYLDLTDFKRINDTHGHEVGDRVLAAVADRLRGKLRESDLAARVGGDEFAVLLPEVEDAAGVRRAGGRLIEELNRPLSLDGEEIRVDARAGAALYPKHAAGLDELLDRADRAMYRTRDREDTKLLVHGEETDDSAAGPGGGEAGPEADPAGGDPNPEPVAARANGDGGEADGETFPDAALRRALDRDELSLHYQPIVRLPGHETVGAEALLRWRHPNQGLIEAGAFLPGVRDAGLMRRIDRWALQRGVDRARRWAEAGEDRWVAVNLAVETLAEPGLPAWLDGLMAEKRLRRDRLLVEATVGSEEEGLEAVVPTLRNLRAKRFRVALDYSGPPGELTPRFSDVPADLIKVDGGFLGAAGSAPGSAAEDGGRVVRAAAEALGAGVLLKRVETERAYESAAEGRFSLVQGFYSGRPVPAGEIGAGT